MCWLLYYATQCAFGVASCCAVLVCLSMCGHGSGNGTPCAGRAICASSDPLGVYIYAVGVESCATRLPLLRSVPLTDPNRGRAWHLWSSLPRCPGACRVVWVKSLRSAPSVPLPAPPLPSSSRRYAPQCFVAGIPASRLATCPTAHPTNRVVACRSVRHSPPRPLPHLPQGAFIFVASALADVPSARLTSPAYPPERSGVAEGELNAGCKSAALETAFGMGEMREVWYNMRMKGSSKRPR